MLYEVCSNCDIPISIGWCCGNKYHKVYSKFLHTLRAKSMSSLVVPRDFREISSAIVNNFLWSRWFESADSQRNVGIYTRLTLKGLIKILRIFNLISDWLAVEQQASKIKIGNSSQQTCVLTLYFPSEVGYCRMNYFQWITLWISG